MWGHSWLSIQQSRKNCCLFRPQAPKRKPSPLFVILGKNTLSQVSVTDDCWLEPLEKGDSLYPEVVLGVLNLVSLLELPAIPLSLSFFFLFVFYWSIIALQCSIRFCFKKWVSNTYTYIPSILNLSHIPSSHPSSHRKALSWTPYAMQLYPTSYLVYT